jgi:glycerate 2-kinase
MREKRNYPIPEIKILIATDSFKESISSADASAALKKGLSEYFPEEMIACNILADGGEGTAVALISEGRGTMVHLVSSDPLGRKINSFYGVTADHKTAVIELAAASGLALLSLHERNPLIASTYGTGILIKNAIEKGIRNFIICLGGSATNDAGAGLMTALGVKFYDADGKNLGHGGKFLNAIKAIDLSQLTAHLSECRFTVACDVTNPLTGPEGASAIFGPQKGASPEMVAELDFCLSVYADKVSEITGSDFRNYPGAGAAGGTAFSLLSFLKAELKPGFALVAEYIRLEEKIKAADIIITGEGRLDNQSIYGKTVAGIAALATKHSKRLFVVAGQSHISETAMKDLNAEKIISLTEIAGSKEKSLKEPAYWLENAGEIIGRKLMINDRDR